MEEQAKNALNFPKRVGYACLNTELRAQKPTVFCSRTARLVTMEQQGIELVKELGRRNVVDLLQIMDWNEQHGIRFLRMSSDMFPFASHLQWGYTLEYCTDELAAVGQLAKRYGHRLTTHPGQTNNLGSPHENVVLSTMRDLEYHAEMMDRMGLDQDSVMIIHMGGKYDGKAATMERFAQRFADLSKTAQDRLVLENDEYCYNVEELLPLCETLKIPLVFDYHHHSLNPGTQPVDDLLQRVKASWKERGITQKMHYSESNSDAVTKAQRRKHSKLVKSMPMCGSDVDLMIEAKGKEQAVLELDKIYKFLVPLSGNDAEDFSVEDYESK